MEGWIPGEAEIKKALNALFNQKPPPSISKIDPICHVAVNYVKVCLFRLYCCEIVIYT